MSDSGKPEEPVPADREPDTEAAGGTEEVGFLSPLRSSAENAIAYGKNYRKRFLR